MGKRKRLMTDEDYCHFDKLDYDRWKGKIAIRQRVIMYLREVKKSTFRAIGEEFAISHQRAHQLYSRSKEKERALIERSDLIYGNNPEYEYDPKREENNP